MAVVPPRARLLERVLAALQAQQRPPDHLLLAAPVQYARFAAPPTYQRWLRKAARRSSAAGNAPVEVLRCRRDDGPGTKLCCTLARAHAIAASPRHTARPSAHLVLADDDQAYAPWALHGLEAAVARHGARQAFSYYLYTVGGRQGRT